MEEIKVGDIVRVTDWGSEFSSYDSWFKDRANVLKLDWLIHYAYNTSAMIGHSELADDLEFRVLYVDDEINKHILITPKSRYLGGVYLIGIKGVELYDKSTEMTISEIEEKLGIHNLKIIKENTDE